MAQEHEIKISLKVPLGTLVEQAEKSGFCKTGEAEQEDVYFDTQEWGLYNEVAALRTRAVDGLIKEFTYKKLYCMPKRAKPWFVEELETGFPIEGPIAQEIFERLGIESPTAPLGHHELVATLKAAGFQDEQRMPKHRLIYRKEDMELVVDSIDGLGVIVELESPTQDAEEVINDLIGSDSWERSLEGTGYLWLELHKGFTHHKDYDKRLKENPTWNVTDRDRDWYDRLNTPPE
jgi:adenylate cyclase class IV